MSVVNDDLMSAASRGVAYEEEIKNAINFLSRNFTAIENALPGLRSLTAAQVASQYVILKALNDTYSETGKALTKCIEQIKHEILPERFESEGLSSFTTTNGYRVTVNINTRASIVDKLNGYEWLKQNNLGDLITETVNASTLSSVARGLLEEGKELPSQYFKVYLQPTTSVTKTK